MCVCIFFSIVLGILVASPNVQAKRVKMFISDYRHFNLLWNQHTICCCYSSFVFLTLWISIYFSISAKDKIPPKNGTKLLQIIHYLFPQCQNDTTGKRDRFCCYCLFFMCTSVYVFPAYSSWPIVICSYVGEKKRKKKLHVISSCFSLCNTNNNNNRSSYRKKVFAMLSTYLSHFNIFILKFVILKASFEFKSNETHNTFTFLQ